VAETPPEGQLMRYHSIVEVLRDTLLAVAVAVVLVTLADLATWVMN
jgi:hypothetical protein